MNGSAESGRYSGASTQRSIAGKNKRKRVRLGTDKSLCTGNPAVDNVDLGKHRDLSHFKQNSRPSG